MDDMPQTPVPPHTPPTEAVPAESLTFVEPRKSNWPMAIGIICCLLGGMGLAGGLIQFVVLFLDFAAVPEQKAVQLQWKPVLIATSLTYLATTVLLLVGGLMLVQRRYRARKVLLFWSVLRIVTVVVSLGVLLPFQRDNMEVSIGSMGPNPVFTPESMEALIWVGNLLGLAWACALPVFLLWWLCRGKIIAAMATWRGAPNDDGAGDALQGM